MKARVSAAPRKPFRKSDGFRRVKLALKRFVGREPRLKPDIDARMSRAGDWWLCSDALYPGMRVYSLGVGENIDFDLALIETHDAQVYAFDPTPNSIDWLRSRAVPNNFHFFPWAVAAADGVLFLYPRMRHDGSRSKVMFTLLAEPAAAENAVEVPARTLASIARELGHERVDVLKMDIEGAEYEVIRDLLDSPMRPTQLLIEFHHRFAGVGVPPTLEAIAALRAAGYRLAYISSTGREFTFLLPGENRV